MSQDLDTCIDRQHTLSVKWCRYEDDVLPLWVADMDFRSPEPVVQALHERVAHGIFGYCTSPDELREVIVERLSRLYDWQVCVDDLVFISGVVTGFNLACHAFGSPGDNVLVQTPVYYPMLYAAEGAGQTNAEMELTRRQDGQYEVDFDLMAATMDEQTSTFILCNPHNPVGRVFRRDELERMAELCLANGTIICSDEIHCDLVCAGHKHVPIASLSPEIAERTITLMAPSKTFNIPGLKCSVAVIQNEELRKTYASTHRGLVHGVNVLGYTAALAAYRDGGPWLERVLGYLERNLDCLMEYVDQYLPGITMARPEGTYLAWLNCREAGLPGSPHEFFLERARVALNEGAAFGKGGEGFVRLNFACPRERLTKALDRMKEAMEDLSPR